MEMLKKSGIALVLGALMLASVPTTTECISQRQTLRALGAVALISLAILHFQKYFPKEVTDNQMFKTIIGTPKIDNKLVAEDKNGDVLGKLRLKPEEPSTGCVGKFSECLGSSIKYTLGDWANLIAIAAILGLFPPAGH